MGRGGGRVGGSRSHHSRSHYHHRTRYHSRTTYHSKSYGGGYNSGYQRISTCEDKCSAFFLALVIGSGVIIAAGVVCLVTLPLYYVVDEFVNYCTPTDSLNRNEQAICHANQPFDYYFVEYDKNGDNHASVYQIKRNTFVRTKRNYTWLNYHESLSESFSFFSVSSPVSVDVNLVLRCQKGCSSLKLFWLISSKFTSAGGPKRFDTSKFYPSKSNFVEGENRWSTSSGSDFFYLVFATNDKTETVFDYDIYLNYVVYDMSNNTAKKCERRKCKFQLLEDDDYIIVDYLSSTTSGSQKSLGDEPEYFGVSIYATDYDTPPSHISAIILACLLVLAVIVLLISIPLMNYCSKLHNKKQAEYNRIQAEKNRAKQKQNEEEQQKAKEAEMEVVVTSTPGVSPSEAPSSIPTATPGSAMATSDYSANNPQDALYVPNTTSSEQQVECSEKKDESPEQKDEKHSSSASKSASTTTSSASSDSDSDSDK